MNTPNWLHKHTVIICFKLIKLIKKINVKKKKKIRLKIIKKKNNNKLKINKIK